MAWTIVWVWIFSASIAACSTLTSSFEDRCSSIAPRAASSSSCTRPPSSSGVGMRPSTSWQSVAAGSVPPRP